MNDGGEVFFSKVRIPIEAALRAVTIDATWECQLEARIGAPAEGKLGDLTILEQGPTGPRVRIGRIKVSETWMDGIRHRETQRIAPSDLGGRNCRPCRARLARSGQALLARPPELLRVVLRCLPRIGSRPRC